MPQRRHADHPFRARFRAPPLENHLGRSVHQLVPEAPRVLVVRDESPPPRIAPAGQNAPPFGAQLLREVAAERIGSEGPLRNQDPGLNAQPGLFQELERLPNELGVKLQRDDRPLRAVGALAAPRSVGVVQGPPEVFHQALACVKITLHLFPFERPLLSQPPDAIVVQPIRDRRPEPSAALSDDRGRVFHAEVLQHLLDLALRQVHRRLQFLDREAVAGCERREDVVHAGFVGEGVRPEESVNVLVLAPRHHQPQGPGRSRARPGRPADSKPRWSQAPGSGSRSRGPVSRIAFSQIVVNSR